MARTDYNGFKNRTQWNVSLWINNDQGLYELAKEYVRISRTRREAAQRMLEYLCETGTEQTPDGCRYSATAIQNAMVGL